MIRVEESVVEIRSEQHAAAFFKTVLTTRECKWVQRPWKDFEMDESVLPQRKIGQRLHGSTTTANRGAVALCKRRQRIERLLDRISPTRKARTTIDSVPLGEVPGGPNV